MKKVNNIYILLICLFITFSCKKKSKNTTTTPEKELFTFNYQPQQPLNGKLLGVVELGASGFNSFIINIDKNLNWKLKKKEYGISLIVEGMTNTHLVNEKLKEYIEKITLYGVDEKDIYFVVSSGASKEKITQIISTELQNIGYTVNNFTAKEEGKYALQAVLPKEYKNNAYLVDIGSGNTKISYFNPDGTTVTLETYGAKYYQKGTEPLDVFTDVKKIATNIPIQNREYCFIIGGVPTKLARFLQEKEEPYTILNTNVKKLEDFAAKDGKKTQSGLNIYKAIQEATESNKIIYVLDGNFSTGFLMDKIQ